jgi:uncharacterized damage-inducible protein DinB
MTPWEKQLLDIWKIHTRINLEILDWIDTGDLEKRLPHYEMTIGGQFAHIHRVRVLWLRRETRLSDGLSEIEPALEGDKGHLRINLEASAKRVEKMLAVGVEKNGSRPYFPPHLGAFVG